MHEGVYNVAISMGSTDLDEWVCFISRPDSKHGSRAFCMQTAMYKTKRQET